MDHLDGVHMLADWQGYEASGFRGALVKVNNWVPAMPSADALAIERARESTGAAAEDFLIAYVGRLEHVKGVDLLIDAVRALPDPRIKLAIVGVGLDEASLRARGSVDTRIRFVGYSSTPAAWYGAADLIVMPSRHEPFALVALEAMACGAPILASNVDGFAEIFRDRPDCLVPLEDPTALARGIAERMARKASPGPQRERFDLSRFDRAAGIAAVTRFYDEVLARRDRRPAR
jgi:glycosyltransferase involved in cell wall biosynthesis